MKGDSVRALVDPGAGLPTFDHGATRATDRVAG